MNEIVPSFAKMIADILVADRRSNGEMTLELKEALDTVGKYHLSLLIRISLLENPQELSVTSGSSLEE